jgi:hypothetical protein
MAKRKRPTRKAPIRVLKPHKPAPAPPSPDLRTPKERIRDVAKFPFGKKAKWPEGLSEKIKQLPQQSEDREATLRKHEEELFPGSAKARQQQQPRRKRAKGGGRKEKLTPDEKAKGFAYLHEHPKLTPKQAYPGLRKAMNKKKADISDSALYRAFRAFWKSVSK